MNDDSVGMGYLFCPVCGKEHSESVLLATQYKRGPKGDMVPLRAMPRRACTGLQLCDEHRTRTNGDAMVWLVGAVQPPGERGTELLGRCLLLRRDAWPRYFKVPAPSTDAAYMLCDGGVIDELERIAAAVQGRALQ